MNRVNLKMTKLLYISIFFLFTTSSVQADPNSAMSIFDEMHYKEVLELTIKADFEKLRLDRRNEEYQAAELSFKDEAGNLQEWDLKVKLRGKFRRMNCSDIPPLKLKFKKSDLAAQNLADFNDMKLVTQCVPDKALAMDLLKREYAAYRLYNEISEYSYRVQLLKVTYIDTNTGTKRKEWAFLIEDTAQLRARFGLEKCEECLNQPIERFYQDDLRIASIFQYMIGNSDWSYLHGRNVKLLLKDDKIIAVPYDFDFSGLVSAPYAAPSSHLGILHIKQRVYLGYEEEAEKLYNVLYAIYSDRARLADLITDMKFINRDSRTDMVSYLNEFFENFEDIETGEKDMTELVNTVSD